MNLSSEAYHYIAGIMEHAKAFTAITNPTVNSYKRLVPGYEAPCYIAWSGRNRSPLIRIPAKRGSSTRIELRSPDPSCNPYLALAVQIKAGLDGVKRKLNPPEAVDLNIFAMDDRQRKEMGIDSLPGDLKEALTLLSNDEVIKDALGEHIYSRFVAAKTEEYDSFRIAVHKWEIDRYLEIY